MQKNTDTLGGTRRSNSTGGGIPRPAGAPDTCRHRTGRQSTIVVAEKLTTRRRAAEMNIVSLRDSLVDVLHTLQYVGAQQLIDTANQKNDFEFRFCQKCYKPPQNTKRAFSRREKNRVIYSTQSNIQRVKNTEVTSSTTKREVIEVTLQTLKVTQYTNITHHLHNSNQIQSCLYIRFTTNSRNMEIVSIQNKTHTPYGPYNLPHMVLCIL